MEPSVILITVLTLLTLAVLVVGVLVMAKGGKTNQNLSNKLMVLRVVLQGLAIVAIAIVWALAG